MKCFPSESAYRLWRKSAGASTLPCADCTPQHQAQMAAQGRCERPDVVFVMNKVGGLVGRPPERPDAERVASVSVVQVATRLLGVAALAELIDVSATSLPHYRNGNRTLPVKKFEMLRAALLRSAGLLVR